MPTETKCSRCAIGDGLRIPPKRNKVVFCRIRCRLEIDETSSLLLNIVIHDHRNGDLGASSSVDVERGMICDTVTGELVQPPRSLAQTIQAQLPARFVLHQSLPGWADRGCGASDCFPGHRKWHTFVSLGRGNVELPRNFFFAVPVLCAHSSLLIGNRNRMARSLGRSRLFQTLSPSCGSYRSQRGVLEAGGTLHDFLSCVATTIALSPYCNCW